MIEYRELIHAREIDIETLEKQVIDLSTEIEILRSDNTKIQIDLEAQRDLCDKLDIQKEKLEAELVEYQMCTKDLCAKNDKLKDQIHQSRVNSGGGGDGENFVSSYHPTM